MKRLQYRCLQIDEEPSVLAEYTRMEEEEVHARLLCDYYVYGTHVYTKESLLYSEEQTVIYVSVANDEEVISNEHVLRPSWRGVKLEVRQFKEESTYYPLLGTWYLSRYPEVMIRLVVDQIEVKGKVWIKTSTEFDENRKTFVLYVQ
ncbi:hypothetical protein [Mechercharimyces sp. CAU 1602]|uniref:hypothetical protein n=1 Tax=Mechercharimyces sp. CAU 1602 TaxID=2973933 RepID=UPI0021624CBB|nr:hypothetical protein [Mechercharimyces sp. CAU 1602]MCS1350210.1 hypothetical protein [Mechercharimyces sp. CAU 1602]